MQKWLQGLLMGLVGFSTLLAGSVVQARHQATVVLQTGARTQGVVRYLPASRSYEIQVGAATREVRADEVVQIILAQPPAQLQQALANVRQQRYQQAIPVLAQIVEEYAMFGPDVEAGKALMLAYLRTGQAGEALRTGEAMVRRNSRLEREADFANIYWEVLLEEKRLSTLRTSIREAIQSGSRELAAVGLLRRGDMEMREGRPREALIDGYLRVVLLFQDVGLVQPEALFKAIRAHEELNEVNYAERWRQRLLANFATSEFAQRLR